MVTITDCTTLPAKEEPSFDFKEESQTATLLWKRTSRHHAGCFGRPVVSYPTALYQLTGWEMQGQLRETAHGYQETISAFLVNLVDDSDLEMRTYTIRSLLLGPNADYARPYIVIICNHDRFSKHVRDKIIQSRILTGEKPRWGCFRLPYAALAVTRTPNLRPPDYSSKLIHAPYEVFIEGGRMPLSLDRLPIEIWKGDQLVGKATIRGLVAVSKEDGNMQTFGLTAAHPFERIGEGDGSRASLTQPGGQPFLIDESELEVSFNDDCDSEESGIEVSFQYSDGDSEDSSSESDDVHISSSVLEKGRPTITETPLASSFSAPFSSSSPSSLTPFPEKTRIGCLAFKSEMQAGYASGGYDWALIALNEEASRCDNGQLRVFPAANWKIGDKVLILASRPRVFESRISSTALFGLPISKTAPQPVFVLPCGDIRPGDCGCWAVNGICVLGLVIGACLPLKEVYVLPFKEISKDLYRQAQLSVVEDWMTPGGRISPDGRIMPGSWIAAQHWKSHFNIDGLQTLRNRPRVQPEDKDKGGPTDLPEPDSQILHTYYSLPLREQYKSGVGKPKPHESSDGQVL